MSRFIRRIPELLAIEGWYDTGMYKFKLSCRFADILRCSEFLDKERHFISCFRKGGGEENQPAYRCMNPSWAIIYTPDKHGNFMGRAFVHMEVNDGRQWLVVDKIYGNRLNFDDIRNLLMKTSINECHASLRDTYLRREAS
jgi:hypothetical protein